MTQMTCRQAHRFIHLRLDGELGDADAGRLDQHLGTCAECARLARELGRLDRALRQGLAAVPTPEADSLASIRQELTRARPRPRLSWRPYTLAAAAVVVAVIASTVALQHTGSRPPAEVASGGQARHVFTPGAKVSHTAEAGEALAERTIVWGTENSRIPLQFADGTRLDLGDGAVIQIGGRAVTLFKGSVRADLTRTRQDFALTTPWGVIVGSGGIFSLTASAGHKSAYLETVKGAVHVRSNGQDRLIRAGCSALLRPVSAQTRRL